MGENQPSGGQSQREKEFVLDFSKFGSLAGKFDNRLLIIAALIFVLFVSGYLRYLPTDKYPPEAPLGGADNWWMYRHTNEIYEHSYPGTDVVGPDVYKTGCPSRLVCLSTGGSTYWDYLHDAPEGSGAPVEFYFYFVAYSYKFFFKFFFPTLMLYINFVPVIFGTLAALFMFLLAREAFGNKSGLAAAFIFGISTPFLQRSAAGQTDTDAVILFFVLLVSFLFFRAWNKKSFKWAALAGISMFFFAFTWPGGYANIPFLLVIAGTLYYSFKLLELNFGETGHLFEFKYYYLALIGALALATVLSYTKGFSLTITLILAASLFGTIFLIPAATLALHHHAKIREQFSSGSKFKELLQRIFRVFWDFARGRQPDCHPEWLGILVLITFLGIGLSLIAIFLTTHTANIFGLVQNFVTIRAAQRAPSAAGADIIRNVFLTVAEFNPASARSIFFYVHIAPIFLAISSLVLLPVGLLKKFKEKFYFIAFISIWLVSTYYASLNGNRFIEHFSIPVAIFASIIASSYDIYDRPNREKLKKILVIGPIIFIALVLLLMPNMSAVKGQPQFGPAYIQGSFSLASQIGGGEGQNWLDFYKWARENTPEGTVFASWWDPGHGFTALAERPAVADGSQNHKHVHDLAIMFTTTNATEALELMEKYDIAYFYTSSDLISKYGAISFLASGNGENYQMLTADRSQVTQTESGGLVIPYPLTLQTDRGDLPTTIVLALKDNFTDSSASWVIGNNPPRKIARVLFFDQNGNAYLKNDTTNETIDMLLYVYPGYGNAFFLPPHIEENTLTRLHLFNGDPVKGNFELVKNFGDEIKVFRVKYQN